jgi:N-acetylmuramoyl-L-alanine amidase
MKRREFIKKSSTLVSLPLFSFQKNFKLRTVVIDAGHGGKDPGTLGKFTREKDIVLKIALKTGNYIEQNLSGVKVLYTRENDRYVDFQARADVANKNKADLFISIHANSIVGANAFGTETFIMGLHKDNSNFEVAKRENSVILMDENYKEKYEGFDPNSPESYILFSLNQSAYQQNSLKFAQKVEDQFKNRVGRSSRGVKQAGFLVLWMTTTPSVLIETGFLSNSKEEAFLATDEGQNLMASGIYRAFKDYKTEIESLN